MSKRKNFSENIKIQKCEDQNWICANKLGIGVGMKNTFFECPLKYDELPIFNGRYLFEADHKEEASEGGDNSLGNCQILCHTCHAVKTKFMATRKKLYTSHQVDAYNSGPMDVEPGSKRKRVTK